MSYYLMTYKTSIDGGYEMEHHYPVEIGEGPPISYVLNEILYEQWFQPDKEAHLMSDNPYTGYTFDRGKVLVQLEKLTPISKEEYSVLKKFL